MAVFRSAFTRADLLSPAAPASVTMRQFHDARAAAGFPRCPTARTISYVRLGLSWPELKEIVLDPSRNQAVTVGRRCGAAARRLLRRRLPGTGGLLAGEL